MICDIHQPDGKRFEGDPRYVAQRAAAKAREMGYEYNCGPELEFFILQKDCINGKPQPVDHGGYFDFHPLDLVEDIRRELIFTLQNFGIDVEMSHHEVAPSQHEVDFRFGGLVSTADRVITYKMVAKTIAHLRGYLATFMPKPLFGENGSGMHTHQSLWRVRDNKNAFYDPKKKRPDALSDDAEYLNCSAMVEIKIGQGAKPGIGGHLPGEKVTKEVSETRMIPKGADAISPAPQHDIYSIEDLATLIAALKEATNYERPVGVKIAAVHNSAAIASGIVRAGADFLTIDGFRGGTGAAPKIIRDNVGIPIELALAAVDARLHQEGLRNQVSLLVAGGFRNSGDVLKAIILGADAVCLGTSALIAMGCTVCQKCHTGVRNWGICTNDPRLAKRLNPEIATRRLKNLLNAWSHEIKEMLGGMGVNSIESARGNRLHLRGVGLEARELEVLGVRGAGQ